MKVTTESQLLNLKCLIGAEIVEAGKRIIADGGEMWIFLSPQDVDADTDLNEAEKRRCKNRFEGTGGKYAGWARPPLNPDSWYTDPGRGRTEH
jgi:hypothetical protein